MTLELKKADRLTFSTYMQLKIGHKYFKSYLYHLLAYDTRHCHGTYTGVQSPDHILMHCRHFRAKQQALREELGQKMLVNLRTLLTTKEGIKQTLLYLRTTRIATRR